MIPNALLLLYISSGNDKLILINDIIRNNIGQCSVYFCSINRNRFPIKGVSVKIGVYSNFSSSTDKDDVSNDIECRSLEPGSGILHGEHGQAERCSEMSQCGFNKLKYSWETEQISTKQISGPELTVV